MQPRLPSKKNQKNTGLPRYDKPLAVAWLSLLSRAKADWTNAWRSLSSVEPVSKDAAGADANADANADADADADADAALDAPPPLELARALAREDPVPFAEQHTRSSPAGATWEASGIPEEIADDARAFLRLYRAALGEAAAAAAAAGGEEGGASLWPLRPRQDASNPAYVPRNHLMYAATEAIEKEEGEGGGDGGAELRSLLEALRSPFTLQEGKDAYRVPAPLAPRKGVELLSCSS